MRPLDLLVPAGIDDPRHPSGGNRYDLEVAAALEATGWSVRLIEVAGPDGRVPSTDARDRTRSGAVSLVDGLLLESPDAGSGVLPENAVPLLHMPPSDRSAVLDRVSRAPVVITTSASTRERVLDLLVGRPAPGVLVVPPGLGRTRAVDVSPSGRRLRCIATLVPAKGQDVLLAALARLRDLDWQCELVGAMDRAPAYVAVLREQADRFGIGDRVTFAGAWPPDPITNLCDRCDLLVLPSRSEAFGMVIAEAIGCGVPVIASDTGGTREAMGGARSTRPGILVRPGDPAELARALRVWLSNRGLRLDLTGAARSRRNHRRTWETTAGAIAEALDAVAPRTEGAHHVA